MKAIKSIFIILIFTSSIFSQDNKIEIIYNKAYKNYKDTTDTNPKILKNLQYKLICTNNSSKFEYVKKMDFEGTPINKKFIGKGGGKGINYKNLKTKERYWQIEDFGDVFLVKEKFNKYQWELFNNESKEILGYICFKAEGTFKEYSPIRKKVIENKIVVWYAPSIPLPYGPAGFDGLPGIVLESLNGSFYFTASKINFHKNNITIKKPTKGKKVTHNEFNKLIFQYFIGRTKKQ
jgi:GLPGLI family protein